MDVAMGSEHELRDLWKLAPRDVRPGTESIRGKAAHLPQHRAVASSPLHSPHQDNSAAPTTVEHFQSVYLAFLSLPQEMQTVTHT